MLTILVFAAICIYSISLVMRFSTVLCAGTAPLMVVGAAIFSDLSLFVLTEKKVALQGVLNNIGSSGKLVPGAADGLVIASPSKVDPDCRISHVFSSSAEALTLLRLLHMDS